MGLRSFADIRIRYKLLISYSVVFFLSIIFGSMVIYSFVRRNIESSIESELKNSTATILNMVRTSAAISIKNHLRAVAERNLEMTELFYHRYRQGDLSEEEAKERARHILLNQTIGKTGYTYCIDSRGIILLHPREALRGADLSAYPFIRDQLSRKEGYLEYDWKNPGESHLRPKALYMTYFEPWDWIISVSSYRNEFYELVKVDDFRESILSLQFGRTGYSYVLDTVGNLIVHPKLEGHNYFDALDAQGRHFIREICRRKSGKITYSWKNPDENASREKLVIFNHIPEYDWIVASSSYLEEFYAPLQTVRSIIFFTVLASLALVIPISMQIGASITNPLRELMRKFRLGADGDISVRMQLESKDEIGRLARYFNLFMERLEAEIGERRQVGRALRESERQYRLIADSMPSVLVGVDAARQVTQWNREAEKMTGLQPEQALGKKLESVLPQLQEQMEIVRRALHQKAAQKAEKVMVTVKGGPRFTDIMVYPLVMPGGAGAVIRMDDVTARVRMEEMMIQTEKMMSIGGLAAGMAHEINNPVGGMIQSAQNILRRISPELKANRSVADACGTRLEAVNAYLEQREIIRFLHGIRESGIRTAEVVTNMLNFSRKSESRKKPVDMAGLLEKTVALAAHDYDLKKKYDFRSIDIVREYESGLPKVPCVATEIEQVLLNLLRNAAQAMAAESAGRQPPRIILRLRVEKGSLCMEVADTGPGIDEKARKRVFEPFYTTKDVGIGTGLGLSVAYFIVVNNHHGTMSVDSGAGRGASFVIRLPLAGEETTGNQA